MPKPKKAMSEHPIIFSAPMIRAILEGRKTQTRRLNLHPTWQVGDRLWVKETWMQLPEGLFYRATDPGWDDNCTVKWRAPIYMPRLASRITLEIVGLRTEPLHCLSVHDAIDEGVRGRKAFATLWDSINGKKAAWDSNPLVRVIEFRTLDTQENQ